MKKNYKAGFTLIELLVVIAIIAILSSVIIASLDSARSKGDDAAAKEGLSNAMSQAELFYDSQTPNSYTGVCTTGSASGGGGGINEFFTQAAKTEGLADTNIVIDGNQSVASGIYASCNDGGGTLMYGTSTIAGQAWAAEVPLKNSRVSGTQDYFCVDSSGQALVTTSLLTVGTGATSYTKCTAS